MLSPRPSLLRPLRVALGAAALLGCSDAPAPERAAGAAPALASAALRFAHPAATASARPALPAGYRLRVAGGNRPWVEALDPQGRARLRWGPLAAGARVWLDERGSVVVTPPPGASYPLQIPFGLSPTTSPAVARKHHTLTPLPSGKILIAGGKDIDAAEDAPPLDFAEVYDPLLDSYTTAGQMASARYLHAAALRSDGRVVLLGGSDGSSDLAPAPEVFDPNAPAAEAFSPLPSQPLPSVVAPVVPLSHAEAMVFSRPAGAPASELATHAFRVDLFTGATTLAGALLHPRRCFAAELLASGRVLVAQGEKNGLPLASTELGDPAAGAWTQHLYAPQGRSGCEGGVEGPLATVRLPSGDVLMPPRSTFDAIYLYRSDSQDFVAPFHSSMRTGGLLQLPSGFVLHRRPPGKDNSGFSRIWRVRGEPGAFFLHESDQPSPDVGAGALVPPALALLPDGRVLEFGGLLPWSSAPSFYEDTGAAAERATVSYHAGSLSPPTFLEPPSAELARYDAASDALPPWPPSPVPRLTPRRHYELASGGFAQISGYGSNEVSSALDLLASDGHFVGARCLAPAPSFLTPLGDGDVILLRDGSVRRYRAASQSCQPVELELGGYARAFVALDGGRALVRGGESDTSPDRSEILEAGALSAKLLPGKSAILHTKTALYQRLLDGQVLHFGEYDGLTPQQAERIDPATGEGKLLASAVPTPRLAALSLLLPDGKVLIAGGEQGPFGAPKPPLTVDLFDPKTDSFSTVGPLDGTLDLVAMRWDTAQKRALLLASRALPTEPPHAAVYAYDPETQQLGPQLADGAPPGEGAALTRLPDGRMLLSGKNLQLVDPTTLRRTPLAGASPRSYHTATLLASGRVLLAGGLDAQGKPLGSLDEFDPLTGSLTAVGAMLQPRAKHTATPLPDGRILLAGGTGGQAPLASLELLEPGKAAEPAPLPLQRARAGHGAALLPDGRVLFAGGTGNPLGAVEIFDPLTKAAGPAFDASLGTASALALASGDTLLAAQQLLRIDSQGQLVVFTPEPKGALQPGDLQPPRTERVLLALPGGTVVGCGGLWCYRIDAGGRTIAPLLGVPQGAIRQGAGERTPLGSLLLALPPRGDEPNAQVYTFDPAPAGVARPALVAPATPFDADAEVTLAGERLLRRAVVGGEATTHPSAFPSVVWMPEAGGGPIFAHVTAASDTSVTFRLPGTAFRGAGFLHALVTGVPSQGVFAVLRGLPLGKPCSSDAVCQSGSCVDGVCCNTDCASVCLACSAAAKGHGQDGLCEVLAPTVEEPLCGKNLAIECRFTGLCSPQGGCLTNDGDPCLQHGTCKQGACEQPKPSSCNDEQDALVSSDGHLTPCSPFRCQGGQCLSACSSAEPCLPGFSCTTEAVCRRCASPFAAEIPASGSQPASQQPCGDYACRGGACLRSCQDGDDSACAKDFFCRTGRCRSCAEGNNAVLTAIDVDHGGGEQTPCERVKCVQGQCLPACQSSDDCQSGWVCERGACVGSCKDEHTQVQGPDATTCKPGYRCVDGACVEQCTSNRECLSGFGCQRGECSKLDEEAPTGDPGACSAGKRGGGRWGLVLLAGALAAALRRRPGGSERPAADRQRRREGRGLTAPEARAPRPASPR